MELVLMEALFSLWGFASRGIYKSLLLLRPPRASYNGEKQEVGNQEA